MIAFSDASALIYLIEGAEPFATRLHKELAAAIRVRTGLKTPDTLQAASCLQLGPDHLFLTGDAAFRRVADLKVKVLA